MKKLQSLGALIVALSMGAGSLAMAQDRDRRGPPDRQDRPERHDDRRGDGPRGGPQFQGDRGGPRPGGYDRRAEWRGAGPDQRFHRGDRLPPNYRSRQYVVEDWRGHHLTAPPRGYHWVQTGGDYVLAAIATGVILQILLNQ